MTKRAGYVTEFNSFWKYFVETWMERYSPKDWNINAQIFADGEALIINRTNNPLERFNRTMNQMFTVAHPTMAQFVNSISQISTDFKTRLADVQRGISRPPAHDPFEPPVIPQEYLSYIAGAPAAPSTQPRAGHRK